MANMFEKYAADREAEQKKIAVSYTHLTLPTRDQV